MPCVETRQEPCLGQVSQVLKGVPKRLAAQCQSSLGREPVQALHVGVTGVEGDACSDTKHHGGLDKVLHHYPAEHYRAWRTQAGLDPTSLAPGAFGENLSTLGVTEEHVCVGDVIAIGKAVLQVSQGRQPCWKLNLQFGSPHMAAWAQSSGRLGWYYRVISPGRIVSGDAVCLVYRPHPQWSIARAQAAIFGKVTDPALLQELATLTYLSSSWRILFARRLATGQVEGFDKRMVTPTSF